MTPYERVRKSRELTAATFPLPSVLDCVRYAICELAEYDDALLRQERTGDKRNNDKAHDPRNELGQALYMLLSASVQFGAGPVYQGGGTVIVSYFDAMYALAAAGMAWAEPSQGLWAKRKLDDAYSALLDLCNANKYDVFALIDDTCAVFEAKHAPREAR